MVWESDDVDDVQSRWGRGGHCATLRSLAPPAAGTGARGKADDVITTGVKIFFFFKIIRFEKKKNRKVAEFIIYLRLWLSEHQVASVARWPMPPPATWPGGHCPPPWPHGPVTPTCRQQMTLPPN